MNGHQVITQDNNSTQNNTYSNIIKAACFLFGAIIITSLLCPLFNRKDGLYVYDSLAVRVKCDDIKAEPDNSIQIIFLGDSESYSAFFPEYLKEKYGYSSFVCGTAAQKICDSYAILHENFKTQSPNIVVLETNNLFRKLSPADDHWDPVMNICLEKVPLFTYHSEWKPWVRSVMPQKREQKRRANRGFVKRITSKAYTGGKYMKKTQKATKIDDDVKEYLAEINKLCREHNATLVLVSVPSAKNWNYKKHNSVDEWALDNSVPFIDLNLEDGLNIDWEKDTKDGGDHMNLSGAEKVTEYIGKYFKENYDIDN